MNVRGTSFALDLFIFSEWQDKSFFDCKASSSTTWNMKTRTRRLSCLILPETCFKLSNPVKPYC